MQGDLFIRKLHVDAKPQEFHNKKSLRLELGLAQKLNNSDGKTLLWEKKLLAFLRPIVIFSLVFTLSMPASASAFSPTGMLALISGAFFDLFQNDTIEEAALPVRTFENDLPGSLLFIPSTAEAFLLIDDATSTEMYDLPNLSIVQNSAILSPLNPQGIFSDDIRGQITTYVVKDGDNLTKIAQSFGVTLNTILWANNIKNARLIKPGDTLVILPVSGVRYTVKSGDTLSSIAKKFKGSVEDIAEFNGFGIDEKLAVGTEVIIPDGELQLPTSSNSSVKSVISRFTGLPEIKGYYLRPVAGGRNPRITKANPQGIHGFNGVDMATSCGTPIAASANGTVLIARSSGWNGGYGRYVVIAHPNGTQTLYGHMIKVSVSPGQGVQQGDTIGQVGSTGNSTGCHLHFEIRGAKNPFY